jgi:hypothetical protein|tara:strand:+ start:583 stop:1044 length:462 start_codon:yes stop_codon:yes gene_type:complete
MATFLRYRTVDGYLQGIYVADAAQADPDGEASVDVSTTTVDPAAGDASDTSVAGWLTDFDNTVYHAGTNTVRLANAGEAAAKIGNTRAGTKTRLKAGIKALFETNADVFRVIGRALIGLGVGNAAQVRTAFRNAAEAHVDALTDDELDERGPQ